MTRQLHDRAARLVKTFDARAKQTPLTAARLAWKGSLGIHDLAGTYNLRVAKDASRKQAFQA